MPEATLYCECEQPVMDVEHDAGCRRCGRPVDFTPAYPHEWQQEHSPDCPVVRYRADLLRELAADPNNPYLLGALPEYDGGGDQEAENCTCGHWHPFRIGTRVRLRHAVDRFPHFLAPAGGLGTVTQEEEVLTVKLDEHLPGAEDWDNEVLWSLRDGDNPNRDLEVVPS